MGGFTSYDKDLGLEKFHSSVDRLMHGLKLYKTGKVKKIMLSGGSPNITNPEQKEALILFNYLQQIGFPNEDLIVEPESKNTYENAINSTNILNEKYPNGNFVLITSGFHMPRAKRCFDKAGLKTTPFSVDNYAGKHKFSPDHLFIPSINALYNWQVLLHEWAGLISYKLLGYI